MMQLFNGTKKESRRRGHCAKDGEKGPTGPCARARTDGRRGREREALCCLVTGSEWDLGSLRIDSNLYVCVANDFVCDSKVRTLGIVGAWKLKLCGYIFFRSIVINSFVIIYFWSVITKARCILIVG